MRRVRRARTMSSMGFFDSLFSSKRPEGARDVTFTLVQTGHTYEDGNVGLKPTSLTVTPESKRVAVIGLNGSGKTTLLQLLDGALAATSGSVRIDADGVAYDPSVKRDLKRIESMIGRVRREEIPNSYYKALFSYDKQVVFATHDTELITRAEYAIDRTLVVDDHQVVFDGGPHEAVAFYTDLIRAKYEACKA